MGDEDRILAEGFLPTVHQREALRGEFRRQSELVHLHGGGQLHDEPFAAPEGFGGFTQPLDLRSRTVHPAGMTRGRDDLPQRVLHVIGVSRIVLLGGEMDHILRGVVVRQAGPVLADRDEVLRELVKENVDVDPRLLVILGEPSVLLVPVFLHGLVEGPGVGEREGGLLDIE